MVVEQVWEVHIMVVEWGGFVLSGEPPPTIASANGAHNRCVLATFTCKLHHHSYFTAALRRRAAGDSPGVDVTQERAAPTAPPNDTIGQK